MPDSPSSSRPRIIIAVCITCRQPGAPEDAPRIGHSFANHVADLAEGTDFRVVPVKCLSMCKRPAAAALMLEGGWKYAFAELDPATDGPMLVDGAHLFATSKDGMLPWQGRPDVLKRKMVARIPPFDFPGDTVE